MIGGGLLALFVLVACDDRRICELEEGVATEADVRTFEYNRQPAGQRNYMIAVGPDGRMNALRQVLTPANFAKVQPGMSQDDVRRLLGKPAKITPYERKREVHADWRYLDAPSTAMVFAVIFSPDDRVLRTLSVPDPEANENRGGR